MNTTHFKCFDCKQFKKLPEEGSFSTGYGFDADFNKICYTCCGLRDKKEMKENGKITLYLKHNPINKHYQYADGIITNWASSLVIKCRVKKGKHNIAGTRYDVWFTFEGEAWYGVQYGEHSQLCYCKRLKQHEVERKAA